MINDGGLFAVLNAHATMMVEREAMPTELALAFSINFVAKAQGAWLQPPKEQNIMTVL